MNLSSHFTFESLIVSQEAARRGIDNTPSPQIVERLRYLVEHAEIVREEVLINAPMLVSSGYRCEDLERVICADAFRAWSTRHGGQGDWRAWREYFARKSHPRGLAMDFTAPAFGTPLEVCRAIAASEIDFDQVIHEFGAWCHLGVAAPGEAGRRMVLTIDRAGERPGLGLA